MVPVTECPVFRPLLYFHLFVFQYFKNSLNTRLSIVYIETWQDQNQAAGFARQRNIQQAMKDFSEYVGRKLYTVDRDTTQLLT